MKNVNEIKLDQNICTQDTNITIFESSQTTETCPNLTKAVNIKSIL
jgi:hypothetical protein